MKAQTRCFLALPTGLALLFTTVIYAAEPKQTRLAPISKWVLKWEQDSCVLARRFGTEKIPVLLSMRSYAPGYAFQFTLAGSPVARLRDRDDLTMAAGESAPFPVRLTHNAQAEGYGTAMVFSAVFGVAGPDLAEEEEHDPVTPPYPDVALEEHLTPIVSGSRPRELVFETGPMGQAFKALRTCTDDLVQQLGIDPESQHGLTRNVQPTNLRAWASHIQAIYPSRLSNAGKGARVIVRVVVDAEGNPTRCDFFQTFTNTEFAVQACDIIKRKAKFAPALDKTGQPVPSIYTNSIVYYLN